MSDWEKRESKNKDKIKGVNSVMSELLSLRGVNDQNLEIFLNPSYEKEIHDSFKMRDMDNAVSRILSAIKNDERTLIFGDYDADGVLSSSVISLFFKKVGYENFHVYIPDRQEDGYGLNRNAISEFAKSKGNLIVTVDCGITGIKEVDFANKLGLEVIITDHHLPHDKLPKALAIVNPKRIDCEYPFKELSGTGVAYKLVQGLSKKGDFDIPEGWEKWLLDLVAISIISDMMSLTGENRAFMKYGLLVARKTQRLGLRQLLKAVKIRPEYLNEDDIAFMVSPRLNAAGRMSHASQALNLLTTENPEEAKKIVKHLEEKNQERRTIVTDILEVAEKKFFKDGSEKSNVLVVGDPSWPIGVLGIAAGRLVDLFHKPAFVWGKNGTGLLKGSCRSDGTVNMVELMGACGNDYFSDFGGHEMAGGFSVNPKKEKELEKKLSETYEKLEKKETNQTIHYDMELFLDDVGETNAGIINNVGPYGNGNPKPVFLFREVSILDLKVFGNGGLHLELSFSDSGGKKINAIGFFAVNPECLDGPFDGSKCHIFEGSHIGKGEKINLLANIEKSYFKHRPEVRLRIVDIKSA